MDLFRSMVMENPAIKRDKMLSHFLQQDLSKIEEAVGYLETLAPRPSWEEEKYGSALEVISDFIVYWKIHSRTLGGKTNDR